MLDQKDVPLELQIGKLQEHAAESYAMLIVYGLSDVKQCYALNPEVMMEVMVPDHPGMLRFEETGVPWTNVIAFVGHQPPSDASFYDAIHAKGSSCIVGTSRNFDREFSDRIKADEESLRSDDRNLLDLGADVVETDLPRELGSLLFENAETPSMTNEFFSLH